jgi:hypothetical protein
MADDLADEIHRKLVVSSGNWGMGRKDAFLSDGSNVGKCDGGPSGTDLLFVKKLQGEETGMTLVHVETVNVMIAKSPEDSHSPNSKNHFLSQSVTLIPSVEAIRKRPIPFIVFWKVTVKEVDRDGKITDALYLILPCPKVDGPSLDGDRNLLRQGFAEVTHNPSDRLFLLPSAGIEALIEIPFSMKKRHTNQRESQVCGRSEGISRQDPQTAAVGRHSRLESNFHRKVGDVS